MEKPAKTEQERLEEILADPGDPAGWILLVSGDSQQRRPSDRESDAMRFSVEDFKLKTELDR